VPNLTKISQKVAVTVLKMAAVRHLGFVKFEIVNGRGRMHDAGVRVSPGLKSTYDGLASTPVCMTPT